MISSTRNCIYFFNSSLSNLEAGILIIVKLSSQTRGLREKKEKQMINNLKIRERKVHKNLQFHRLKSFSCFEFQI